MRHPRLLLCLPVLLGGCEADAPQQPQQAPQAVQGKAAEAPAPGKAKEGVVSINAPGFNLNVNIPESMAAKAKVDEDNGLLYPGATVTGLHVQAGEGRSADSAEIRFTSTASPSQMLGWYRDPARGDHFSVTSVERQGEGFRLTGADKDGDPFSVSIAPAPEGGTRGQLTARNKG